MEFKQVMKRKFFDTRFAKIAGLDTQLPRVLKYAVANQSYIFSTGELMQMLQPIRTILKTPMAVIVDNLMTGRQLTNFAAFYVPGKDTSIPEILTAGNITLDLNQIPDPRQLASLPLLRDKVLVNITGAVRPTESGYTVSAVDVLQNRIVRGQLVASYWTNDTWPNTYVAEYAIKSYCMVLSALISRYYNLSMPEQLRVSALLAFFMAQWLTGENYDSSLPPLFLKMNFLGNRAELTEIAKQCTAKNPHGLTMQDLCELIAGIGPDKIATFNISAFTAICGNLGGDLITSSIALEYPPYWIYMLIASLSGAKIPLLYQLNSQRLINEGRSKWLNAVFTDQTILSLSRN